MASPAENSSSSRSTPTTGLMPGRILVAYDATKSHNPQEFRHIITKLFTKEDIIQEADIITLFGVMHKVLHPMGFQIQIGSDSFIKTRFRAIKQEVSRMIDASVSVFHLIAEECERNGINIEVKIVVGSPMEKVLVQEAVSSNATWVVLDRHLKKEARFYLKHIPCKVGLVRDDLSLEILRPNYYVKAPKIDKHKLFYTSSKMVPIPLVHYNENVKQVIISPRYRESLSSQETSDSERSSISSSFTLKSRDHTPDELVSYPQPVNSGNYVEPKSFPQLMLGKNNTDGNFKIENGYDNSALAVQKGSDLHINLHELKSDKEMRIGLRSVRYHYSEIKQATDDFSSINLMGEDEFGDVYKGQLKDGQVIVIKVQRGTYTEEDLFEFHKEICVLSLACHKNIAMLLGYCSFESRLILVHEYVCNKSLEWHLFDNADSILAWYQRHAIAIGIAKGLRYLHEECKGSPIFHQDLRLSNVLLTHEFVPMLGDYGLAKMKKNRSSSASENSIENREYLSPEHAESCIVSVKTDVYAFGIILLQLISGHKAFDPKRGSLRQWALPLIKMLAFDKLVDHRLGDSFSTYEVYQMAKAAELCLRAEPETRPMIGHVLHVLEGTNSHLQYTKSKS